MLNIQQAKQNTYRLAARITLEERDMLEKIADKHECTISEVVRAMIRETGPAELKRKKR